MRYACSILIYYYGSLLKIVMSVPRLFYQSFSQIFKTFPLNNIV